MDPADALTQIDSALEIGEQALDASDSAYRSSGQYSEAITICSSTIDRLTAPGSVYGRQAKRILDKPGFNLTFYVEQLVGILKGLRHDIESGYLQTLQEEIHADVFADLLEMADQLLSDRYPLPAAVVAGAALEAQLRALAEHAGVATHARGKPKRAGMLNDDLAKKGAYSKAEQKQVLAWQDLRKGAAHGGDEFSAEQVRLMLQGVLEFVSRHPA
jgi:hypothetical protein